MQTAVRISLVALVTTLIAVVAFCGEDSRKKIAAKASFESCEEMHADYFKRFIEARGNGAARMPQPLMLDHSRTLALGSAVFSVEKLELIGILNQDVPVAYVLMKHGENGLGGRTVPRKLTEFESKCLAALREGKDLLIDDDEKEMHLVGAVRAQEGCLKCHEDKKVGDLLGAFTYKLKRVEPPPQKSEDSEKPNGL